MAAAQGADEVAAAPRVRLVLTPTAYSGTGFVEAAFRLSEDAYVLVVAVDLDRRIRVLHPESPDESGFATAGDRNRLTRFFAGFGGAQFGRYTSYSLTQRISPFGGEGVMIAIASERPLQLERLMDAGGDWDEDKLANLVFDQSLAGAAHALGRALVLTGQEYSTDYTTLGGRRTLGGYTSLAARSFGDCGGLGAMDAGFSTYSFGYADGPRYDGMGAVLLGFHRVDGQLFARYAYASGGCGRPLYYDVPVPGPRVTPPDTTKHDTTVVARRQPRFPGAPRFPQLSPDSASGPLTRRSSDRASAGEATGRLRPPVAGGLRFRPPEQLPVEGIRPAERRMTPRDLDAPARRAPSAEQAPPGQAGDAP
ncbi:MAG TPA: hypothetical protein VFN38_13575, partial [Gemmatimonadaceae bacterium]|nr:hypothetical protein [Gemmatimonadaceae bacterium]